MSLTHIDTPPDATTDLTIARLGARGDGVAITPEGPVYIPYALPGENVRVDINKERGTLVEVLTPSVQRRAPECPHFTRCGGCVAQHMDVATYRAWKCENVQEQLKRAGVSAPSLSIRDAHGAGRRRVTWHVAFQNGKVQAGFMSSRSHDLIAIDTCPILHPDLQASSALARALMMCLKNHRKAVDVHISVTQTGLDVDMRGSSRASESERLKLIQCANTHDLARLCVQGELIVERRAPTIQIGNTQVHLPIGSFLQATEEGENILGAWCVENLKGAKKIADLFSGCGPFALRLAQKAAVHAVESHAPALKALEKAVRATKGLKPVTTEVRDLFRRPLLPVELKRFDAVVLDPPRAGALAQVQTIVRAKIPHVMMISCDASSFARDVKILEEAGYTMGPVTLIDQFLYSPHVELACVLML
jgi:23S rRNA (uracil1939-C5)-methyltransferase